MLLRPCLPLRRALGRRLLRPPPARAASDGHWARCGSALLRRPVTAAGGRLPSAASVCVRGFASQDLPPHREVVLPALSPTMETGSIVSWEKQEGDELAEGDLLAEIETDKASMGFENEEAGYLAKILVPAGTKDIPLGKMLCIIVENKEDVAKFKDYVDTSSPASAPAPAAAAAPAASAPAAAPQTAVPAPSPAPADSSVSSVMPTGSRVMASPRARKLAAEQGVDLSGVQPGSDGLVRATHVSAAAVSAPPATPAAPAAAHTVVPAAAAHQDIELTAMRKTIAKRLLLSKQTIPHYYLTVDIDATNVLQVRADSNARAGADGPRLSVNDFVIKAAALACLKVPEANSSWMETFIRQYQSVDISVAVATEHGLITPIVTGAERRGVADISRTVRELATRARARQLKPHEFQGGTFSISNLGMFGVRSFSAIVNPPQSCILAVGGVERRLVPGDEAPRTAHVMAVTLSCDHRVVDGAVGAQWLAEFRRYMEQPVTMIL